MASANFSTLVKLVATYVGEAKAAGLVERRLERDSIKADQFTMAQLNSKMQDAIVAVAALYLTDPSKEGQLRAGLAALAGS